MKDIQELKDKFYNTTGEKPTINITPEIADYLENHYFLDTEFEERIEAFKFKKLDSGLQCEYIGTDLAGVAYNDDGPIDEYKTNVDPSDTYNGYTIIDLIENHNNDIHEINESVYNHIKALVEKHKKDMDSSYEYLKTLKETILRNLQK